LSSRTQNSMHASDRSDDDPVVQSDVEQEARSNVYVGPNAASPAQLHGALIEVCDLGILILGPSGVGKSECVIELVRRGQRMVADDVVRLSTSEDGRRLIGRSPESIRHHIEVRGIGLLSVADLFGPESVLDESPIDFVCRLEGWTEGRNYERIGLERPLETFLGVALPTVTLPVHAASNLATLVELAARDWKLRQSGVNAAQRLDERLRSRDGILESADSIKGEGS
jgi:HPr kinase/phosphorylase